MALINQPPTTPVDIEGRDKQCSVRPEWRNFFVAVFNILNALTMSGTTAQRPTTFLWTGRTYFDTDLGLPVWWDGSAWVNGGATMYHGSATLNFPNIASNGIAELTLTVTGAVAGDRVVLAAPAAIEAGLTFSGFVSAADTVSIRLHNNSGGALNPASATWGATVFAGY